MLVPISYNLRSIVVRRAASLLTILGIGATVAVVSGVLALVSIQLVAAREKSLQTS